MLSPADADLVRRDRDLPDLALLLDADLLGTRLERTLGHREVADVQVTYLRYKPGQSCLAACRAVVAGQQVDLIAKAYRPTATEKFQKAVARDSVPGPLGAGRFVLDDSTVLVSVFPNDGKVERLARLMSPDGLAALAARFRIQPGATVLLETLRYNPHRRFVGRMMAEGASVATVRCYSAMEYPGIVAKAGALTSRGPLRLARRLTRMHRFCLLGFEWLHGDLLEEAVAEKAVPPPTMELVGNALAHLHAQEAPALPPRTNASQAAAIVSLGRHLALLHPPIASLVRGVAERVAARLARESADPRPLHGDFYGKQVLLSGATAALIDLDESSLGDPAIDLARFQADLEASAVSGRLDSSELHALVEPLLTGYRLARNQPARLNLHVAAQLLRLSAHPFRRREPSWPDIATAILERAAAFFERDTTECSATVALSESEQTLAVPPDARNSKQEARAASLSSPPRVVDPFGITSDPVMPFLPQALKAKPMAERFARDLCGLGRASEIEVLGISVTRYKPRLRCLVAYDLAVHERGGAVRHAAVMGKVRAQSADTSTHELLETLWTGSFAATAEDDILVPEPLGVVTEVHMIVQRRVAGEPLGRLLEGPAGLSLARRAADAIHKLHSTPSPARRRHTVDDELRILRQRLTGVAQDRPNDRVRIERLLEGCVQLAARVRDGAVCGIHRDFYPDQLLADGDRLYLTDLDLYSEGPPALDIGNFVAHIDEYSLRRFGDPDRLADRHDMLVERYLQLSGATTREDIDIWTTLSLARHVAISTQFAERRPFTAALLDLCEVRVFAGSTHDRASSPAYGPPQGASR